MKRQSWKLHEKQCVDDQENKFDESEGKESGGGG